MLKTPTDAGHAEGVTDQKEGKQGGEEGAEKIILFLHLLHLIYRVFGKYCPIGRLGIFSAVMVFYKSASIRTKGKCSEHARAVHM